MKISVNTRLLLQGRLDGIGWFIYEHFSRICRNHPEHEFHFFFDRTFDRRFLFSDNVVPHVLHPQARHPILFRIWYDYAVPRKLKEIEADLFVSPDMMCSLRTDIPQLVVLHDLNFEHYPQDLPKRHSKFYRKYTPKFAEKAKRIVTVSEYSRQDIIQCYGVKGDKIDVVYNAAGESYKPVAGDVVERTRKKLSDGKPYFVFVSSIHPRKNLQRVLPAFDMMRDQIGAEVKLVVVGKKFWDFPELDRVYSSMKYKDDVVFTGRLEQQDLNEVTASALASLYVSYYEGFGLPVVEAMKAGVPVIASNASALPEIAGGAAIEVDPYSVEQIAYAMIRVYHDENLRKDLKIKGHARASDFSWEKSSEELWNSMMKTLNHG